MLMKKTLSMLLAVLTVLALAACAFADTWTHEASGISIALPEGMTGEDISEDGIVALYVDSGAEDAPVYFVFIEYDEDFAGLWMEDLGEEALESIAEYYVPSGETAAYVVQEGETATLMYMLSEDGAGATAIALLNGWFISVEAMATEGNILAEGAYAVIDALVAGIQLPEA